MDGSVYVEVFSRSNAFRDFKALPSASNRKGFIEIVIESSRLPKKNLLFLIHDLERGGPELRLLQFAKRFPNEYKIHICVMSDNLSLKGDFELLGAEVLVLPIGKSYISFGKLFKIRRYIKENKITIINFFESKGLLISLFIKYSLACNIIAIYHNIIEESGFPMRQRLFLRKTISLTDYVICNSHFSRNQIEKHIPRARIRVIHNGVDTDFFCQNKYKNSGRRSELGLRNHHIVLGTVANFRKQKNYPFLIHAFSILASRNEKLRLLCIGGGDRFEEITKLVKELKLEQKVFLTGYADSVRQYLSIMDVFVLTSIYEGLPNALMEAMAMGIPSISSNVGGCPELIENLENGILFNANDMDGFIESVEMLLNNPALASKFRFNASRAMERGFSLNRMIKEYIEFYEEI